MLLLRRGYLLRTLLRHFAHVRYYASRESQNRARCCPSPRPSGTLGL